MAGRWTALAFLALATALAAFPAAPSSSAQDTLPLQSLRLDVAAVARLREESREETCRVRNEALNRLYRAHHRDLEKEGGSAGPVPCFNAILRSHALSTFDDFLAAETKPVKDIPNPAGGPPITVMGALGSDLINPWLVTAGIIDGAPLEKQPMYDAATHALREHTDFALVGIADPSLGIDDVPAGLRDRVRAAYRRLNPGNRFDGGFDHPLFYACIREAARKLFREDHPGARMTMDRLVLPESKGGFGIASCLLCHGQNHADVYKRLLGEAMHFESRVSEGILKGEAAGKARHEAEIYRRSAQIVLEQFPDKIDPEQVKASLAMNQPGNLDRLKPGYDDFAATLEKLGCVKCHSTVTRVEGELRPDKHGAFMLNPNSYHKVDNIKALAAVIDLENVKNSELLRKVSGKAKHRGSKEVSPSRTELAELEASLELWVRAFLK